MTDTTTPSAQPESLGPVETIDVEAVNEGRRKESLFKKREPVFPKRVSGPFRRFKWAMMIITLGIYYLTPWIRWDRGPNLPDQAVLIDMPARRFYFFFIEIWPQEVYYITGLLILSAVALFLVTSLAGRMWCGYSCPQTVWTDLFYLIERRILGNRNERIRLSKQPWSFNKFQKLARVHIAFILVGVLTGGAWVFYFADAPTLLGQLMTFTAPVAAYLWIGIFTATTYVFGGLAREQICTYMCPWPRIQSAMLDEESLAVTYRFDRGEPRGAHKSGDTWDGRGDCIDCKQCIAVCPTGIDIREGLQLECIQCALCIDSCNEVMRKVGRPEGLIAYDTDKNLERRQRGEKETFRFVRPRTLFYVAILAVVSAIMLYALATRSPFDLNVLHDRNPVYVQLADGSIRNAYTLKILNKSREQETFNVTLTGVENVTLSAIGSGDVAGDSLTFQVAPDTLGQFRVFAVVQAADLVNGPVSFVVTRENEGIIETVESIFRGPDR